MPMDMHPSSGETSSMAQMPQKANSRAMETMSRLSVERLWSSSFRKKPKPPPSRSTSALMANGFSTAPAWNAPVAEASATEIAML